jgi:photosystem II stability/assembly factor-like uncharacterized protein
MQLRFLQLATCILMLATALSWTSRVEAGPIEQLVQVAMHPSNSDSIVLRYVNGGGGFFYTADGGRNWKLLCNAAVERTLAPSALAIAGDGKVLIGTRSGVLQDDGTGCGWQREPALAGKYVSDFAVHPTDPNVMFAATATVGDGAMNGILRRDEGGVWSEFGVQSVLPITKLQVVSTDHGLRFYTSATKGANVVVRTSDDDGKTWDERPVSNADGQATLQKVDPSDPERLLVAVSRPEADDTLLVSVDGGHSYREYLTITELGSVAVAPDGRVWIADTGGSTGTSTTEGIWSAASMGLPPEHISEAQVACLSHQAASDTLYACERWRFGPYNLQRGCVASTFQLYTVSQFVSCAGADMASTCEAQLCADYCRFDHFPATPVCAAYDTDVCGPNAVMGGLNPVAAAGSCESSTTPGDGGAARISDAGAGSSEGGQGTPGREAADAGRGSSTKKDSTGGCSALAHGGRSPLWLALVLLASALGARRERLGRSGARRA